MMNILMPEDGIVLRAGSAIRGKVLRVERTSTTLGQGHPRHIVFIWRACDRHISNNCVKTMNFCSMCNPGLYLLLKFLVG